MAQTIFSSVSKRVLSALNAFGMHLMVSIGIAMLVALVVMGFWYPYPYRDLAGGQHLFWILVGIDVVCGPLLTLLVFNPNKSRRELTIDIGLIGLIQLGALAYGLYSIGLARPVMQVFEVDRFVVVSAAEIDPEELSNAVVEFRQLSWSGPKTIGTRSARNNNELLKSIELSIQGQAPSARPDWWQPYEKSIPDVQKRMRSLEELRAMRPEYKQKIIDNAVEKANQSIKNLFYLPLTSRKNLDEWIVLLDINARILGYIPVDGF